MVEQEKQLEALRERAELYKSRLGLEIESTGPLLFLLIPEIIIRRQHTSYLHKTGFI